MFGLRRSSATATPLVVELSALDKTARATVGLKAANLGELLRAGASVPPGFVVTPDAFRLALGALSPSLARELTGLHAGDERQIQAHGQAIEAAIAHQPLPRAVATAVHDRYDQLHATGGQPLVAVRSSVVVPGDPDGRATEHSATVLNVRGADAVIAAVRHVWSASFTPAALTDWLRRGINPADVTVAVVVQQMVAADCAGVLYTADPATNDRTTITIEAVRGLGAALTSGQLNPDRYAVDRESLAIVERTIARQPWQLGRSEADTTGLAGTRHLPVPTADQSTQKLTDDAIIELARIGRSLVEHFGAQLDIEWAISGGTIYVLEARPVPAVTRHVPVQAGEQETGNGEPAEQVTQPADSNSSLITHHSSLEPLARGASVSLGTATGIARIVHSPADFDRIKRGDIVVAELTTLNLAPILPKAAALVTDTGGRTSHVAIAGREHGIPVVVGTGSGSHTITDGQLVTVDGTAGVVYAGKQVSSEQRAASSGDNKPLAASRLPLAHPLGTKLYAILADPAQAQTIAAQPVDGVGLLRAEFMIAGLGEHPAAMEAAGRGAEFTAKLANELSKFAVAFAPRPVIYRTSDFKSNEYRSLKGGDQFEPHEENPMLGYRGVARYLAEPQLFRRELDAIRQVREQHPNVWLMLPFVRTVAELQGALKLITNAGLEQSRTFKIYMMCELPSNVILLDEFLDAGIDGISIGSNDLTQLILGIDRDSDKLANEFDERDPAVSRAIEYVIKTCRKRGVPVGLCGQAASEHPDFAEKLVEWGITSISVNLDAIEATRALIASIEYHQHKHTALGSQL